MILKVIFSVQPLQIVYFEPLEFKLLLVTFEVKFL